MSDIGADIFAEWGVVPENVVSLSVFPFGSRTWFVAGECSGIHSRLVLFGMEGRLGRMMPCQMKGMKVVC